MLIQKNPLTIGEKVILRLLTGEEVIGIVESSTADEVVLTKPFRLQAMQGGPGLMPFSLIGSQDHPFHFQMKQIVAIYNLDSAFEPDYIQASTGISIVR